MSRFWVIKDQDTLSHCFGAVEKLWRSQGVIRLDLHDAHARTNEQLRTLWMWHNEVAFWLSANAESLWESEDVHELVFLAHFMPKRALTKPSGEVVYRPISTSIKENPLSDGRSMRKVISDAMDQYLAWCYSRGIEITVPDQKWRENNA